MSNEILDTTNKLIKPEDISKSDDTVIKQLSENLQNITPEDIDAMCKEMDEAKKCKKGKRSMEEKINNLSEEEFIELIWTLWI